MDFQPKAFEKNRAELPRPAPLPPASNSLIQSFGRGVCRQISPIPKLELVAVWGDSLTKFIPLF